MKEQVVSISHVETRLSCKQVARNLSFVIHMVDAKGKRSTLEYGVLSIVAKFVYSGFSWRYPTASDGFCQFCDLMSLTGCKSLDEMAGRTLCILSNKDKMALSGNGGEHWVIYEAGIDATKKDQLVSGKFWSRDEIEELMNQ